MELAKQGFIASAGGLRTIMLRRRPLTAYDIYLIHWSFTNTNILATNDVINAALSTRLVDQVEDTTTIGFDDMVLENGIFGVFSWSGDLVTEGGAALVGNHTIPFPKPFRVPWLAVLFNIATGAASANTGLELYFEQVKISAAEDAFLAARVGGERLTG